MNEREFFRRLRTHKYRNRKVRYLWSADGKSVPITIPINAIGGTTRAFVEAQIPNFDGRHYFLTMVTPGQPDADLLNVSDKIPVRRIRKGTTFLVLPHAYGSGNVATYWPGGRP